MTSLILNGDPDNSLRNHAMKTTMNTVPEAPVIYETENDIPRSARAELNALINEVAGRRD